MNALHLGNQYRSQVCCEDAVPEAPLGEQKEEEEEDWGDDFGTFEEAAELADAQPAGQAAEQAPVPPLPQEAPHAEAPEAIGTSEAPDLYSASPEELFDLVSPPACRPDWKSSLMLSHLELALWNFIISAINVLWLHGGSEQSMAMPDTPAPALLHTMRPKCS